MQLDLLQTKDPDIRKSAVLCEHGTYRYLLTRRWDPALSSLPVCMLNPSTADHEKDDPTIKTLMRFARGWGYGGITVVNLFALRTSLPERMKFDAAPLGPDNSLHQRQVMASARHLSVPVLAAWGRDGAHFGRADETFCSMARSEMVDLVCMGLTKEGFPKHPLARGRHRIPSDQKPIMWRRWRDG
jgi:hypothetical protein